jgi:hypothetical protein
MAATGGELTAALFPIDSDIGNPFSEVAQQPGLLRLAHICGHEEIQLPTSIREAKITDQPVQIVGYMHSSSNMPSRGGLPLVISSV